MVMKKQNVDQIGNDECSLHVYFMEKICSHGRCKWEFRNILEFHDFRENVQRKFECQFLFSLLGDFLALENELST